MSARYWRRPGALSKVEREQKRAERRALKEAKREIRRGHVGEVDATAGLEPIDVSQAPADVVGVARTLDRGGPLP